MANDVADWTSAVQISAGSVSISSGTVQIQNAPGTQISTNLPMKQLVQFTAPPNGTTTRSVSLDAGAHCLGILVNSITNIASITVSGDQTGVVVPNLIGNFIGQYGTLFLAPRLSPYDTSVTVAVTMSIGAQTATVWVHEVLDVQLVGIFQQTSITTADQRLQQVALDGTTNSLRVSQAFANPATWEAPLSTVLFDQSLNNNSFTVVAAVANQKIAVHSWTACFSAVAAATVILESDDSATQYAIWNNVGTVGPFHGDSKGVQTAVGKGLRIRNPFAAATTVRGSVTYTQS